MQLHKLKKDESRDQDGKPVYLTPIGIEKLRTRLERLRGAVSDLAAEAARTAAYGDRSDNAEYKQAKGALRRTHAQIFEIEQQLKRAVAIPKGPDASGKIQLGSTVILEMLREDPQDPKINSPVRKTFEIVGPSETDPPHGRISHESPLGATLIGHGIGDVVVLHNVNGMQTYKVLEVT